MVTLAVIPARGGSKRVPGKNKRLLAGRPLVSWSIQAGMEALEIQHVIVSTDDEQIHQLGLEMGALDVGMRERFTDDHAPSSAVTLDAVEKFAAKTGTQPEFVFQLLPTCPLRSAKTIAQFWSNFINLKNPTSAISCATPLGLNPNWAIERRQNGSLAQRDSGTWGRRSQDLPTVYFPSGAIWCARTEALVSKKSFYMEKLEFIEISPLAAFDIDSPEEFDVAAAIMANSHG